jgi:hypothetical protein
VADIGMTLDDVKQRSTLKFKEPRVMGDGSRMGVEEVVFDYRIGDSVVQFPQFRYYWVETGKGGDPHIVVLNIGIKPRKIPKPELEAFQRGRQEQLLADGWMPGHYLGEIRRDSPVVERKANRGRRALLGERQHPAHLRN